MSDRATLELFARMGLGVVAAAEPHVRVGLKNVDVATLPAKVRHRIVGGTIVHDDDFDLRMCRGL